MSNADGEPAFYLEPKEGLRPDKDKMLAFEWIYWELLDKKEDRLAEAARWLISGFHQAHADTNWQAERRAEVQAELDAMLAEREKE